MGGKMRRFMEIVVLVVEDEPLNRKLMRDILTHRGYIVLEAGNGREGVDLAIEIIPDLIFMDIQLPVMDGLSATRLIKADINTRDIPVIAATAYAMKGDQEKVFEAGCSGYVTKPVDIKILLKTVEKYLADPKKENIVLKRSLQNEK
jgi:two-component system cell cycle response regulator DivK